MDPGWHTYWKNGGDSGGPTQIEWHLPKGITAGETAWPVPEKYVEEGLITYIYHDEAVLLTPLILGADLPTGPLQIKADVSWLECEKLCVPGDQSVEAKLTIGPTTVASAEAELIKIAGRRLPGDGSALQPDAAWEGRSDKDSRTLLLSWSTSTKASAAEFFPESFENYEISTTTERVGDSNLRLKVKRFAGEWPKRIKGVLVLGMPEKAQAFGLDVAVDTAGPESPAAAEVDAPVQPLGLMLLYAFVGGLILNIMPCVLPVIALKILGFVGQSKESPRRVRQLGLVYSLGVLLSFLGLAALVIGVKAAGQAAGWGMQFSSPQFTIGFAVLVTLVALNLFGVFEVSLSGGVMSAAGDLASRHGPGGAFFNGVLATVLATPCTAPFLSLALGFAFSQSAPIIVLVFLTVGAGLASPYLVLSWFPAWLKWLPKPGVWMERFKVVMGFPMLATALWLVSLVSDRYGEKSWWLGLFLVFVALAAWIFGTFVQRGASRKGLAMGMLLTSLALGYFWVLEGQLDWRHPVDTDKTEAGNVKHAPSGYTWARWTPAAVIQAQSEGRIAVVDFTAKWCITCNSIVKPAFSRESVVALLKAHDVAAFVADYSNYDQEIAAAMKQLHRAAVPLVLVYPPQFGAPPVILPDPNPLLGVGAYATAIEEALQRAVD